MNKPAMKRANHYLPVPILARLAKLSEATGFSASEHLRRALADYLTKHEKVRR